MLSNHAEKGDWKNVRIIALSLDNDTKTVKERVNSKGWTSIENYHVGNRQSIEGFEFTGIPHCVLVDRKGKITWKGHP